jgi:hypothetical protein
MPKNNDGTANDGTANDDEKIKKNLCQEIEKIIGTIPNDYQSVLNGTDEQKQLFILISST